MAIIRPFRALRYGPDTHPVLEQLISPPGAGRVYPRSGLAGLHPYSVLRLVRGRFDPENTPDRAPYAGTQQLLRSWKQQGILIRDPLPALYLFAQEFTFAGAPQSRRGLVALVHLEPLGKRNVFPHERTVRGPKPDILDQLRALEANLSLTLGLVDDPDAALRAVLDAPPGPRLLADVVDGQGVRCRVASVTDPGFVEAVTRQLAGAAIVIADGHHRYESALTYQREVRRLTSPRGAHPADYVMMLLVPTEEANRSVLPAHRVLRALPEGWRTRLDEQLSRYFKVTPFEDVDALRAFLGRGKLPRYGVVLDDVQLGLTLRRSQRVDRVLEGEPGAWRPLEISAVRAVLLRQVLGVMPDQYATKDTALFPTRTREVVEAVRGGGYQLGVLVRPTPATVVTSIARSGQVMPPKSTHFFPKPAKGLVMRSLKGF